MPSCVCGCGGEAKRRYIKGHQFRGCKRAPLSEEARKRIGDATRKRNAAGHPLRGRTKQDHAGIARAAKSKEGAGNPNYKKCGPAAPNWKGGIYRDKYGYLHILSPEHPNRPANNYVLAHILEAEKTLGRYLRPKEIVHHINSDKTDNSLENLWVCSTETHRRAHRSAEMLTMQLVKKGLVKFNKETGEYYWHE